MDEELKLVGYWCSPYSHRVIWALKLKGLNYDYIEEDVYCKSQRLLHLNPIHKKIPVLVHAGKTIAESAVILEYIEETWPENHPLLPEDPYRRALARFWISFSAQTQPVMGKLFQAKGEEELEKASKGTLEVLKVLEEQGLGNNKFFGGDAINMVDIVHGWLAHWFEAVEEMLGLKLMTPTTFPRLHAWIQNFKQVPVVRENLPDHDALLVHFKRVRDMIVDR